MIRTPRLLVVALLVAIFAGVMAAQSKEQPRRLNTEGSLQAGAVSVFFGTTLFGQLVCQQTFTGQTVIFRSSVSRPDADFAMHVEFLREIVQIADAERAKAPCREENR